VWFQRISILASQNGLEFPGGGGLVRWGSLRPNHLTNASSLIGISRGVAEGGGGGIRTCKHTFTMNNTLLFH